MNLSEHFTLEEMCKARPGFANTPPEDVKRALAYGARFVLQPLRNAVGRPVIIHAGYRSPAYNKAVGGSNNSEHLYGFAGDIDVPPLTNAEIIDVCMREQIPFYQIIDEQLWRQVNGVWQLQQWIHISWRTDGNNPRILKTARNTREQTKPIYQRI